MDSLQKQGFDSRNLNGSIVAWTLENYPLVTGPQPGTPTKKVSAVSFAHARAGAPTDKSDWVTLAACSLADFSDAHSLVPSRLY